MSVARREHKFIVIEGPHGAGKTTIAHLLVARIRDGGTTAVYTKEPFSRELRRTIRRFSSKGKKQPLTLALLVSADRSIHVDKISRWLVDKCVVVCDRYVQSSYVYQAIDGVNKSIIERTNSEFPAPDLTVFVLTSLKTRLLRIKAKYAGRTVNRFLEPSNVRQEQQLYAKIARSGKVNSIIVDGGLNPAIGVTSILSKI